MNIFIVRDFARTDSSEPSVQVWKKEEKKTSCLKKPYCKINYYMLFIFSKGGGRGQHHFSAQHFTRGRGVQVHKISPWEIHFSGAGCPCVNSYGTLYHMWFSSGARTPCSIRIRPCPESRQCLDLFVCFFILYVPVNDILVTSGRFFLCWTSTKLG